MLENILPQSLTLTPNLPTVPGQPWDLEPGTPFPCPCMTQDLACQACIDEALDAWLDEAKETDHMEWGTF